MPDCARRNWEAGQVFTHGSRKVERSKLTYVIELTATLNTGTDRQVGLCTDFSHGVLTKVGATYIIPRPSFVFRPPDAS